MALILAVPFTCGKQVRFRNSVFGGSMKRLIPLLLVMTSFALSGCRRDGEVKTILVTIDSFTTELVNRIETASNPSLGVDDAQDYLDRRKTEITAKMDTLKALGGYQVSDETKQKLASGLVDDASKVGNLRIKYVSQSLNDPPFKTKLDKLVKDYQALLAE